MISCQCTDAADSSNQQDPKEAKRRALLNEMGAKKQQLRSLQKALDREQAELDKYAKNVHFAHSWLRCNGSACLLGNSSTNASHYKLLCPCCFTEEAFASVRCHDLMWIGRPIQYQALCPDRMCLTGRRRHAKVERGQRHVASFCSRARNAYARANLKADFADGMAEMARQAGGGEHCLLYMFASSLCALLLSAQRLSADAVARLVREHVFAIIRMGCCVPDQLPLKLPGKAALLFGVARPVPILSTIPCCQHTCAPGLFFTLHLMPCTSCQ